MNFGKIVFLAVFFMLINVAYAVTPTNLSIDAGGVYYTSNNVVSLTLSATFGGDVNEMQFSCNGSTFGPSPAIAYATSYNFDLTSNNFGCSSSDENKSIIFKAIDGNSSDEATLALSYEISYDATNPVFSNKSPTGTITNKQNPITIDISDATSGIDESTISIKVDSIDYPLSASEVTFNSDTNTLTYTPDANYSEGTIDVEVVATDYAGNGGTSSKYTWSFEVPDTTPPVVPTGLSVDSNCENDVQLSWTKNTESDMSKYYLYRGTSSNPTAQYAIINQSSCSSTCSYTDSSVLEGTTYYYRLIAADTSDNNSSYSEERSVNPNTCGSLSAPSVSSNPPKNDNDWTDDQSTGFSWGSVTGADKYYYVLNNSSSTTPTTSNDNTTGTSVTLSLSNGTNYFHIAAYDGAMGPVTHYKIKFDDDNPDDMGSVSLNVVNSDEVKIDWSLVSDNGSAGIRYYEVYRYTSSNCSSGTRITTTSATEYIDDDPEDGKNYYKVRAMDYASNMGNYSNCEDISVSKSGNTSSSGTTGNGCTATITITSPEYFRAGDNTVKISFSKSISSGEVKYKIGSGIYKSVKSGISGTSSTAMITLTSDDADGKILVKALDSGSICIASKEFKVDTEKPTIKWIGPEENEKVTDKVTLKVEMSDNKNGFNKLTFYDGATKIVSKSSPSEEYSFEWDLNGVSAGNHTLKAVVEDKAGNTSEAKLVVNIIVKSKEELDSEKAIEEAKAKEAEFKTFEETVKDTGMGFNVEIKDKIRSANKALANAKDDFALKKFEFAKIKADKAKKLFSEIIESGTVEKVDEKFYKFRESESETIFKDFIKDQDMLDNSLLNTTVNNIERKWVIVKASDGNNGSYNVLNSITYTNNTDRPIDVQILEFVPKGFAKDVNELDSSVEFEVIESDPVILFTLKRVIPGRSVSLSYWQKVGLEEKADAKDLVDKLKEEFKAPPFVLDSDMQVEKEKVNAAIYGAIAKPMKSFLPKINGFSMLSGEMTPIIVLIFLVIVIGAFGTMFVVGAGAVWYFKSKKGSKTVEQDRNGKFSSHRRKGTKDEGFADKIQNMFNPPKKEGLEKFF